jgi:hypothetical protein
MWNGGLIETHNRMSPTCLPSLSRLRPSSPRRMPLTPPPFSESTKRNSRKTDAITWVLMRGKTWLGIMYNMLSSRGRFNAGVGNAMRRRETQRGKKLDRLRLPRMLGILYISFTTIVVDDCHSQLGSHSLLSVPMKAIETKSHDS